MLIIDVGLIIIFLFLKCMLLLIFFNRLCSVLIFEIFGSFLIVILEFVKMVVGINVIVLFLVLLICIVLFNELLLVIFNFFMIVFFYKKIVVELNKMLFYFVFVNKVYV